MRRRDLSSLLLGSGAGAALVTPAAQAQVRTAPSYAKVSREGDFNVNVDFPPMDVRRYGGVMDGVTDGSAALQAAIDIAAKNFAGGEVYIPEGKLRLAKPITLRKKVSLRGAGRVITTLFFDPAVVATGITMGSAAEVRLTKARLDPDPVERAHTRIECLGFSGGAKAQGALNFVRKDWVLIRDCAFHDFQHPDAYAVKMAECFHWTVEHCLFENIRLYGVHLTAVKYGCNHGVFGPNNDVIGNDQKKFIGLVIDRTQNVIVVANDFEGSGNGKSAIDLAGTEGVWICGNYIEGWTSAAITANSGYGNLRLHISDNVINAAAAVVCDLHNSVNPNSNVLVSMNRFGDVVAKQTCVRVGSTTRFTEFHNDPNFASMTEACKPSRTAASVLEASAPWNPPTIASGGVQATSVPVPGAAMGDPCIVSFSQIGANDIVASAHVPGANMVRAILMNPGGSSIDLPPGTLKVRVFK